MALRNKLDSAKVCIFYLPLLLFMTCLLCMQKENTDLIEVKERLQKECFRVKKECDEMEGSWLTNFCM